MAVYEDCIRAVLLWGNMPGRDKPTTFSVDPNRGYHLPHTVTQDNCVFELSLISSHFEDMSSFSAIAKAAGLMAKDCVLKYPHTGGVAFVGSGTNIEIILHGRTDNPRFPEDTED